MVSHVSDIFIDINFEANLKNETVICSVYYLGMPKLNFVSGGYLNNRK